MKFKTEVKSKLLSYIIQHVIFRLAFMYIPVVQRELDIFRETVWNHSRGRKQQNKALPTGIPDYIYENPEAFDGVDFGITLTDAQVNKAAEQLGVLDDDHDFMDPDLRARCEEILPDVGQVDATDASEQYLVLKRNVILFTDQAACD